MRQRERKEIHWAVQVSRNGVAILNISFNEMAGLKTFMPEDEEAIRLAGEHLLAFLGKRKEKRP